MTADTISRLSKGPEQRARRMMCRIDNPTYIAPENDAWRHENSNSDNEDDKMKEMVEKKLRYWFVKDGKRKRTLKTSPVVPIPKVSPPKIVLKGIVKGGVIRGPSVEPQQKLVDDPVLDPLSISQAGIDLMKVTFEQYIKHTEATIAKDQSASVQGQSVKEKEPEGVTRTDSSNDATMNQLKRSLKLKE
ncbi:hypothetical protein HanRHA438_Chr16g0763911 [Helianthus annuus]|nr:hypothetical protein HanIR_Chr16g0817191 [Helianthus annuus]KAJ0836172.1 hypothetical protein HanRHA438_Chr16g0763911 [Helianthus annuus]